MSVPGMPTGPDPAGQRPSDQPSKPDDAPDKPASAPPSPDTPAVPERTTAELPPPPAERVGSPKPPSPQPPERAVDAPKPPERDTQLDDLLAPTDRQSTELQALREALGDLSGAVRALENKDNTDAIAELTQAAVRRGSAAAFGELRGLREALGDLTEAVLALENKDNTDAIAELTQAAVRRGSDAVIAELRDLGDSMLESVQRSADPAPVTRALEKNLDVLQESIGNTTADIEGIAQALIDLNAGLRDWADGVDRNIGSLTQALADVRELALQSQDTHAEVIEELRAQAERARSADESTDASAQTVADRAEIEQRLKESEELSLYLADQIEDFDRSLSRINDLPTQLEGLVAQALKRTLTAKAKLDADTRASLTETLAALADNVDRMDRAVEHLASSDETLRELATGQTDLASRVDALQDRIEDIAGADTRPATVAKPARRRKLKKAGAAKSASEKKAAPARKRPRSKRAPVQDAPDDRTSDS